MALLRIATSDTSLDYLTTSGKPDEILRQDNMAIS
jgi:hypothetical protein